MFYCLHLPNFVGLSYRLNCPPLPSLVSSEPLSPQRLQPDGYVCDAGLRDHLHPNQGDLSPFTPTFTRIANNPHQVVQTEPVDFSSSQPPPNLTQPNFSPPVPLPLQPRPFEPPVSMSVSSFVRGPSPASQPDSLTRYRAAAQAPTYASLSLPSPYETICSSYGGPGYPGYQQASYSCLPYPPTTFSGMPSYQASIWIKWTQRQTNVNHS